METVIMTKEVNKLEISFDGWNSSPREWSNLGVFITIESSRNSPDEDEDMSELIESTQYEAKDCDSHIALIKEGMSNVRMIFPVCRYEHSGVKYYISNNSGGFDTSHCGFYVVFNDSEICGDTTKMSDEHIEKIVSGELKKYSQWINGEIYKFLLRGDNGEVKDTCHGFYEIDDIKDHLPDEWADEDLLKYLV
jgi:hypothetical protein